MRLPDDMIASDTMMHETVFDNPYSLLSSIDTLVDKKPEEKRTAYDHLVDNERNSQSRTLKLTYMLTLVDLSRNS